jgi:hypothetical protein
MVVRRPRPTTDGTPSATLTVPSSRVRTRSVLPTRLERGLRVRTRDDGTVTVVLGVPSVVGRGRLTSIDARARFEPQEP